MTEKLKPTKPKVKLWRVIAMVVIVLYALSIGPFWRLRLGSETRRGLRPTVKIWERVYFPIALLSKAPIVGDGIEWYINLWLPEGRELQLNAELVPTE